MYGKPTVYERSPDEEHHTIANITQNFIEEEDIIITEPEQREDLKLEAIASESAAIGESTFVQDM